MLHIDFHLFIENEINNIPNNKRYIVLLNVDSKMVRSNSDGSLFFKNLKN